MTLGADGQLALAVEGEAVSAENIVADNVRSLGYMRVRDRGHRRRRLLLVTFAHDIQVAMKVWGIGKSLAADAREHAVRVALKGEVRAAAPPLGAGGRLVHGAAVGVEFLEG